MDKSSKEQEYPQEDPAFQENEQPQEGGTNTQPDDHQPVEEARSPSASDDLVKEKHEGGAEKKKLPFSIGVLIFTILIIIAFVLCLAGMTLGMMDSRADSSCISIWGNKPKCLGSWFRHMDFEDFFGHGECKKADSLVQGAQAFSVMCLIGGFLTSCVALLELFHFAELAVVACIISTISMISTLVVWATMLAFYWSNLCGVVVYADTYKIGNGLILFITAWSIQMVANGVLIIDIYLGNSK